MISTITTATVSTMTVTAAAGSAALVGIVVLLVLLVQKELAATGDARAKRLEQILNIGIIPLLIAFILVVWVRIVEALR